MEDYIKREIDKIGKVIEAILLKVGILKKENKSEDFIIKTSKSELFERLNIDIDKLLQNEDFINILVHEHQFNNDNLELLANLIFDFIQQSNSPEEKKRLISCISKVYLYLDESGHPISFNRIYILEELNNMSKTLS